MGMYTELIFGAQLNKDTPVEVIESLKYMIGEIKEKPNNFALPEGSFEWLFQGGSYYFAINESVNKMWLDNIDKCYHISTRSNIKNYGNEIEKFLEWIKPYIVGGSGNREMYAITMYEDSDLPNIYYLNDEQIDNCYIYKN
jgi:hypothetical protein